MNASPPAASAPARVSSVDVVRGAVIVFMALDHVRDFVTNLRTPPENLARGSAPLFFTRWITHFCAPTFFLLAGVGIGLAMRKRSPGEMSRYLVTRGLWLLVLELIITPVGWRFSFDLLPMFALVLWALGWSMILMAAIIHLPRAAIAVFSIALIFGHNLLDGVKPESFGTLAWLWQVLHVQAFGSRIFLIYPLIPWVGVMALGFVLADVFTWEPARRRRFLITCGAAAVALFIALRAFNAYGQPEPWTTQRSFWLTVSSFLNVRKYPPSLQFLLMTLGPAMVALALVEGARGRVAQWLSVYGRVPMFFYVTHIVAAHLAGMAIMLAQGGGLRRIPVFTAPQTLPDWYGVSLPGVYAAWAAVVVIMYFPCRAFASMKERSSAWWLRYL